MIVEFYSSHAFHLLIQRNLYNFSLLFASNVENLIAFMLQGYMNERLLYYMECFAGIMYLFAVLSNLYWFLTPLADRDEFESMIDLIEAGVDRVVNATMRPFMWVKRSFARLKSKLVSTKPEDPSYDSTKKVKQAVMTAVRFQSNRTVKHADTFEGRQKSC